MDETEVKKQIDDSYDQYKDGLITKEEYEDQLMRISKKYDEYLKRNQ